MSDWTMIYSTDAGGGVSGGSLLELDHAVRAGADVKVVYNSGAGVWWSRYCPSVRSRRAGTSRLVTAAYMVAADTDEAGGQLEFAAPFAIEYHLFNSNGVRVMSKGGQSTTDTVAMRWYVKDYVQPLSVIVRSVFDFLSPERERP